MGIKQFSLHLSCFLDINQNVSKARNTSLRFMREDPAGCTYLGVVKKC